MVRGYQYFRLGLCGDVVGSCPSVFVVSCPFVEVASCPFVKGLGGVLFFFASDLSVTCRLLVRYLSVSCRLLVRDVRSEFRA